MQEAEKPKETITIMTDFVALVTALKKAPIKNMFEYNIGQWHFVINGTGNPQKITPRNCMSVRIPQYCMVFFYGGVYVGFASPNYTMIVEEQVTLKSGRKMKFNVYDLQAVIREEIKKVG